MRHSECYGRCGELMVTPMAFAIIIAIFLTALLLLVRLKLIVNRDSERWRVQARFGNLLLFDSKKNQMKRPRVKRKPKNKTRRVVPLKPLLELLPDIFLSCSRGVRFLLSRIQINRCAIFGRFEGSDPAQTAVLCGWLFGLAAALQNSVPQLDIAVVPGYMDQGSQIFINAEASIRVAALLAFVFVILFHLPKRAMVQFVFESLRR